MKRFLILILAGLTAACASSNGPDRRSQQNRRPDNRRNDNRPSYGRYRASTGDLTMLPPGDWWRDTRMSGALRLTPGQIAELDQLQDAKGAEIAKLEVDKQAALDALREAISSNQATTNSILEAGRRVQTVRDNIFNTQLRLLAAERLVLSQLQWQTLQEQLPDSRPQRPDRLEDGYPGTNGRRPGGSRG